MQWDKCKENGEKKKSYNNSHPAQPAQIQLGLGTHIPSGSAPEAKLTRTPVLRACDYHNADQRLEMGKG